EEFIPCDLVRISVILQQLRIVIGHFLEVWHDPALVNRIAMKTTGKLVVNPAVRHFLQSCCEDILKLFRAERIGKVYVGTGAPTRSYSRILINQQINHRGMRELWCTPKAAIPLVEHLQGRFDDLLDRLGRELSLAPERLRVLDCTFEQS